jgi:hypothetical protein
LEVALKMRIIRDLAEVAFEVSVIHCVETDEGAKELGFLAKGEAVNRVERVARTVAKGPAAVVAHGINRRCRNNLIQAF